MKKNVFLKSVFALISSFLAFVFFFRFDSNENQAEVKNNESVRVLRSDANTDEGIMPQTTDVYSLKVEWTKTYDGTDSISDYDLYSAVLNVTCENDDSKSYSKNVDVRIIMERQKCGEHILINYEAKIPYDDLHGQEDFISTISYELQEVSYHQPDAMVYGPSFFNWNDDYSACKVKFHCAFCQENVEEECEIINSSTEYLCYTLNKTTAAYYKPNLTSTGYSQDGSVIYKYVYNQNYRLTNEYQDKEYNITHYLGEEKTDKTGKTYKECYYCHEKIYEEGTNHTHQFSQVIQPMPASCNMQGVKVAFKMCYGCLKYFSEDNKELKSYDVIIQPHNFNEFVGYKDATCTEDGNKPYYQCKDCNKYFYFTDSGYREYVNNSHIIPKLGHYGYTNAYTSAATCTSIGFTQDGLYCNICNQLFNKDDEWDHDIAIDEQPIENGVIPMLSHQFGDYHEAVLATCNQDGSLGYKKCNVCNNYYDKDGNSLFNLSGKEHVDFTGALVIPKHHKLVPIAAVIPTCVDRGHSGYFSCEECSALFNIRLEEVEEITWDVDPNGHPEYGFSSVYSDPEGHFCACYLCQTKTTKEAHTFGDWYDDYDADYIEIRVRKCSTCNFKEIDTNTHEHEYSSWVEGTPATCEEYGNVGYYECTICHKKFDQSYELISGNDFEITPLGHSFVEIDAIQSTCITHGYYSYKKCSVCDRIFDFSDYETTLDNLVMPLGEHDLVRSPKVDATCLNVGHKDCMECSVCHSLFDFDGETPITEVVQKLPHSGENHELVAPTCTTAGVKAYLHCSSCDMNYDSDGNKLEDLAIPALGHDFKSTWSTSGDKHWHDCTRCDVKNDEANHSYTNWTSFTSNNDGTKTSTGTCVCGKTKTNIVKDSANILVTDSTTNEIINTIKDKLNNDDLRLEVTNTENDSLKNYIDANIKHDNVSYFEISLKDSANNKVEYTSNDIMKLSIKLDSKSNTSILYKNSGNEALKLKKLSKLPQANETVDADSYYIDTESNTLYLYTKTLSSYALVNAHEDKIVNLLWVLIIEIIVFVSLVGLIIYKLIQKRNANAKALSVMPLLAVIYKPTGIITLIVIFAVLIILAAIALAYVWKITSKAIEEAKQK